MSIHDNHDRNHSVNEQDPSARIDFQFDQAGFDFKALPFNIPYPVPFRWLGDEVSPTLSLRLRGRYARCFTNLQHNEVELAPRVRSPTCAPTTRSTKYMHCTAFRGVTRGFTVAARDGRNVIFVIRDTSTVNILHTPALDDKTRHVLYVGQTSSPTLNRWNDR